VTRSATKDDTPKVNRMQTANIKLASPKQKHLVQILVKKNGIELEKPVEELNIAEASKLIGNLLEAKSDGRNGKYIQTKGIDGKVDNAKLGLAIKLVYNNWMYNVATLVRDKKMKDFFIKEVLATYKILQEISQMAIQMTMAGDIHESA